MQEKKLFLLDAMALIYRAYFAFNKNPRMTSRGINTSAIFGFANVLLDLLKKERPTHIGVAFDTIAPTVRKIGFEAYKAHRQETPEDIIKSLPYIHELIEGFNIPTLYVDGYEADDVIGTLAKQAEKHDFVTYMMTSDKDFGQLVTNHTFIYKPGKFGSDIEILGVNEVCNKFSIKRPEQVIDLLGLWGDASDNIPGIPGVGEVTAKKLLAEFDSIENLIANSAKISNEKLRQKIVDFQDQALMSKQLATIILDVPISFDEEKLKMETPDESRLKKLFDELEFRTFGQRVLTWISTLENSKVKSQNSKPELKTENNPDNLASSIQHPASGIQHPASSIQHPASSIQTTPHNYHLIDTTGKRNQLIADLKIQSAFCFDTETTGVDPSNAELVGISFSWQPHEAFYIPLPDNYHETFKIVMEFKQILENETVLKIGQNLKFDISVLKWYDIEVKGPLFDTMLAHYLIQPDMRHGMDFLSETYLNYKPVSIETLIGKKGQGQLSMRTVDFETIKEYAAEDADVTLQLKHVFEPMLQETDTRTLFDTIEVPLITVLSSMEAEGVRIDPSSLKEFSGELEKEIAILENDIHQDAGTTFNISSPKQLGEILYDRLRIVDNPKQTKTKQNSTSEDVLAKMEHKHPIIKKILEYRSLTKLKSTYVDVLPTLINPRDGRIHTSYNQAVAATGRLSSNNPNLQNIPIRTEKGREIRKAFVPRNENYVLLSADYSQIELRIIAHLSHDPGMIEDFKLGHDIHAATAAKVYGVPLAEVNREMRRNAKMVNFGIIYGISAFGLSERLNITRKEGAEIIYQYFLKYPGIKTYMENTIASARRLGYVETMMKRRRYLHDINSRNATVRSFAERNAINAPIQGTAADMIKIAMINIFRALGQQSMKSRMILQVHDELVFDVHQNEIEKIKTIVEREMVGAIPLDVPVLVEMETGKNWLEAH
ncbi:MAG: DNA polymerase I [Bacteroidales bacterium]|jgi:DNA polymerase-1|nr:DNA polymerase I [Bacteroidales bacterium]